MVEYKSSPDRFAELDGLRGIASLWVVLFHFTKGLGLFWLSGNMALASEITPSDVDLRGTFAVELFFIISGYVIFMTLQRCKNISDFFVSRFARLFPAYWLAVIVATAVGLLHPSEKLPVGFVQALGNLTMLQAYIGVPSVDPSYWSLAFELAFYVLIGACFHFGLLGRIETLGVIWIVVSFVSLKIVPFTGFAIPWRVSTALVLPYSGLFFAGIVFFRIRRDGFNWRRCALVFMCWLEQVPSTDDLAGFAILTTIFVVFAFCIAGKLSIFGWRPLVFLGSISYSLYLIHQSLGFRIQLGLHAMGASPAINLMLAVLIVIALATLITYVVEKPAMKGIRVLLKRTR